MSLFIPRGVKPVTHCVVVEPIFVKVAEGSGLQIGTPPPGLGDEESATSARCCPFTRSPYVGIGGVVGLGEEIAVIVGIGVGVAVGVGVGVTVGVGVSVAVGVGQLINCVRAAFRMLP